MSEVVSGEGGYVKGVLSPVVISLKFLNSLDVGKLLISSAAGLQGCQAWLPDTAYVLLCYNALKGFLHYINKHCYQGNAYQHSVQYITVRCSATQYIAVQCTILQWSAVQRSAVPYIVQCSLVHWRTD